MKITDIMIWDWVYDTENEIPVQVNIKDFRLDGLRIMSFFEPIPLTPDILEKNGFVRREDLMDKMDDELPFIFDINEAQSIIVGWRDSYDDSLCDGVGGYWEEYWHISIDGDGNFEKTASQLYVHELQHALKMCGIDKEIVV